MLHFLGAPQHSLYNFIVKYATCKTSWVTWSGTAQLSSLLTTLQHRGNIMPVSLGR